MEAPPEWNSWNLFKEDIHWLFGHFNEIVHEFILRNFFHAFRFDKVHQDEPTSELNLLYAKNWIGILQQVGWFIILIPLIVIYPFKMLLGGTPELIRCPKTNVKVDEKWFFINGVTINMEWLDQNCIYLEKRFNAEVTGILNKSYGLLWDAVEFLVARDFNFETLPVRWATYNILRALNDDNVKTVRLVAHSQGTVIASMAIKRLFILLSYDDNLDKLKKLEVYTFANACREFVNPGVRHIEHYVNEKDPIARLGVLNQEARNQIHGEIFINRYRNDGKGHLFNAFYSLNKEDYINSNGAKPRLLSLPGNRVKGLPIKI